MIVPMRSVIQSRASLGALVTSHRVAGICTGDGSQATWERTARGLITCATKRVVGQPLKLINSRVDGEHDVNCTGSVAAGAACAYTMIDAPAPDMMRERQPFAVKVYKLVFCRSIETFNRVPCKYSKQTDGTLTSSIRET